MTPRRILYWAGTVLVSYAIVFGTGQYEAIEPLAFLMALFFALMAGLSALGVFVSLFQVTNLLDKGDVFGWENWGERYERTRLVSRTPLWFYWLDLAFDLGLIALLAHYDQVWACTLYGLGVIFGWFWKQGSNQLYELYLKLKASPEGAT